ncbi:hypothetical protein ES702_01316 [subsurface metagenome]
MADIIEELLAEGEAEEEQTFEWLHNVNLIREDEMWRLLEQADLPVYPYSDYPEVKFPTLHEYRIHAWDPTFVSFVQDLITGGTGEMALHLQGVYGQWSPVVTEEEEEEPGEPEPEEPEPWETPYQALYPTLTLPRYQAFGAEYPVSDLPVYEPFPSPYPTLQLPIYQQFPVEYPKLGPMYEQAEDVISRMLTGEGLGLPVEELMAAYTEEERIAMEEYIPKLREYWGEKGLLRSGMEREAEREVTRKAASARGTYRANLEKESVIRQQDGIVTGLQLGMQHLNLGYGAQTDAWQAMNREYTKVYESEIMVGTEHFKASTMAWDAAMTEYTKAFSSEVAGTEFGQRIQEAAFGVARDEYQRVYQSAYSGGLDEWRADAQGWDAAWREFDTFRRLLFDWGTMQAGHEFQFEFLSREQDFRIRLEEILHQYDVIMFGLRAELELALKRMGLDAQQRKSIWDFVLKGIGIWLFGSLW